MSYVEFSEYFESFPGLENTISTVNKFGHSKEVPLYYPINQIQFDEDENHYLCLSVVPAGESFLQHELKEDTYPIELHTQEQLSDGTIVYPNGVVLTTDNVFISTNDLKKFEQNFFGISHNSDHQPNAPTLEELYPYFKNKDARADNKAHIKPVLEAFIQEHKRKPFNELELWPYLIARVKNLPNIQITSDGRKIFGFGNNPTQGYEPIALKKTLEERLNKG